MLPDVVRLHWATDWAARDKPKPMRLFLPVRCCRFASLTRKLAGEDNVLYEPCLVRPGRKPAVAQIARRSPRTRAASSRWARR